MTLRSAMLAGTSSLVNLPPQPYYLKKLNEDFSQRQRMNPRFSLRSYARFLKIQPPTLSAVLKGKRGIPFKTAESLVQRLGLSPYEREDFLSSLYYHKASLQNLKLNSPPPNSQILLEEKFFTVIAEWEHYAILTLLETEDFESDTAWIAKRLNISTQRAEAALSRLEDTGLLAWGKNNKLTKSFSAVRTTEDLASIALQKSHREALQMGVEKLDQIPVEMRDFSSIMIAVDRNKMTEAKSLIRTFRKKMAELMEDGDRLDVYQLCIQLYPLTELNRNKENP